MTLPPADRNRILAAFRERIGSAALPAHTTVDDLCFNLLLAIPALVETAEASDRMMAQYEKVLRDVQQERHQMEKRINDAMFDRIRLQDELKATIASRDAADARIATLTAQLEADPCP